MYIKKKYYLKNLNNNQNNKNHNFETNTLFNVPFTKNIIDFIRFIYSKIFHRGIDSLRKELINRKIYYLGIMKDIKLLFHNV